MYSKEILDDLESQLTFIKNNIISINIRHRIILDKNIKNIFENLGLNNVIPFYNEDFTFEIKDIIINCRKLTIDDIIEGYYSTTFMLNTHLESEHFIKKILIYQNCRLFQSLIPQLNLDLSIDKNKLFFFNTFRQIHKTIYSLFSKNGCLLPSPRKFKELLIEKYQEIRLEKRKYLPKIKDLLINDTIYIINHVHGGIKKLNNPDKILIPPTMNFYRVIASDYGACVFVNLENRFEYIQKIKEMIEKPYKNTDRNNKKKIKTIMSTLIKTTKIHMNTYKGLINGRPNITLKSGVRYKRSKGHVHHFSSKELIDKSLQINLNVNDAYTSIEIVHPTMKINLLDYIDVLNDNGFLNFELNQIIDLIKNVKYVLFIDLSCSGAWDNLNNNVILNQFKENAQQIEGNSITNHIKSYVNTSPYNISPVRNGQSISPLIFNYPTKFNNNNV